MAETWLRTHVLSIFPSQNISAVVVGHGVICNAREKAHWGMALPSVKNIQHALSRWGLEREILVSSAFSSDCLRENGSPIETLKPLLRHLWHSNSPYLSDTPSLVSAHRAALENSGFSHFTEIWWMKEREPLRRTLSPAFQNPKSSFSFIPVSSPSEIPVALAPASSSDASPPYAPPPCAARQMAAPPAGWEQAWCVAKPTAPSELLQDAMDYACGEGGADCEEIKPQGSCFYPNNIISHASFAFNSYWQRSKSSGGSCDFNGIAALIGSDPSTAFSSV